MTPILSDFRMNAAPPCPACKSTSYGPEHLVGSFALRRCMPCDALVCVSGLEDLALNANRQTSTSEEFYAAPPTSDDLDAVRPILQFLKDHAPGLPTGVAVDFGAGRGVMAATAASFFKESWALDLSIDVLRRCAATFALPNLHVTDDMADLPASVDAIIAWHTIEHLPDALGIMTSLAERLAPKGAIFWQVPIYRPEYVVDTHFTFFNEFSARAICERAGLSCAGIWEDLANGFITILARKP